MGIDERYAWRRSGSKRDVQLRNDGAADSSRSSDSWHPGDGGWGDAGDGRGVFGHVCPARPPIDRTGTFVACAVADGSVLDHERTPADGAVELQPSFPLVRGS